MWWKQPGNPRRPLPDRQHEDSLRHRWRILPRLMQLLWELGPRHLVLLAVFSLAAGLLPVLSLVVLQRLVDRAVGVIKGTVPLMVAARWLAVLLVAHFLHAMTDFWENGWAGLLGDVQERLKARAQERLLAKANRLSLATFERPEFYDQLLRAERGIETRLFTTVEYLMPIPADLLAAIGLLLYVGSAHFLFPVILLAGLFPVSIANVRNYRKGYALERKQTAPERMLQYLGDLMVERRAAAEIRLLGLQEYLPGKREQLVHQLRGERLKLAREYVGRSMLAMTVEQLTYGLVLVGVVALIAAGHLSVGYFAAYWSAAERFRASLSSLLRSITVVDTDLRYIGDLFDYLDLEEERGPCLTDCRGCDGRFSQSRSPSSGRGDLAPEPTSGSIPSPASFVAKSPPTIRFEAVSFAFPGSEHLVLDGIDLTLHPGERLALVGENGAGKSTLAKLLLGLYSPTAGRITVDGADFSQIDPRQWRASAAVVFQDYVRYELTARENIGFGELHRLQDERAIHAAAVRSGADEVVAGLPAGYAAVLGKTYDEQGQDLSAGQWQKLAIARAYFRDARVLVLDEPTAALDARAEVEVYQQFRDMAQGKSLLLISHRLGSARLADRIVVLDGGRIAEDGRHSDLLGRNGLYARMYSIQAGWYR